MKQALLVLAAVGFASSPVLASEVVRTARGDAPPVAAPEPTAAEAATADPAADPQAQEIGRWARGVLAGAPSLEDEAPQEQARCPAPADRKAHGQVWAGVGTRGYRNVGGVVTQPLGRCGSVTIAIDHAQGGGRRWK